MLEKASGAIACTIVAMVVFFVVFAIPIYKFKDCRKVGHTFMYCILDL